MENNLNKFISSRNNKLRNQINYACSLIAYFAYRSKYLAT